MSRPSSNAAGVACRSAGSAPRRMSRRRALPGLGRRRLHDRPDARPRRRRGHAVSRAATGGDRVKLRVLMEPRHGATYDRILAMAQTTEQAGFDGFFRGDHYLGIDAGDPDYLPTDSWTTLAGLARDTSRIRLGTLMTAGTFRNPAVVAMAVASVDQMSGGRVVFGIGTGWYEREHQAFGIPFPSMGERFDRMEEALADHQRPVDDAVRRAVQLRRAVLAARRVRQLPGARAASAAGDRHRRHRPAAHPAGRRPLRRRVQQRRRYRDGRADRARAPGVRGDRS